jgi:YidC/Oxa1 family membrane protein insertase
VVAALALALFVLSGCALGGSSDSRSAPKILEDANATAMKAQQTQGNVPQADLFKKAATLYQAASQKAEKEPKDPAVAAEALLGLAKVQAGLPIGSRPSAGIEQVYHSRISKTSYLVYQYEGDWQDRTAARDTFTTILQKYDKGRSLEELQGEYGKENAERINAVVDQAKAYEPAIAKDVDNQNRSDIRYKIMDLLVRATGSSRAISYWFAMVLLAVIVKVIISPLTKAQFKSMKEMQKLQPKIKELQEKYKDNQQELGGKMMALYKEHGVNPLSGCLPILIQMPLLIGVYSMIRLFEYRFSQGTFLWIGWHPLVHKISVPIMGKPVWLSAENLAQPDLILLVLYTVSMIVSQKISVVDPTQAEQQKMMMIMMPLMFFFIIGYLPSAFVFYWFVFNVLQTWQQYHIIHGSGAQAVEPEKPEPPADTTQSRQSGRRRRRR